MKPKRKLLNSFVFLLVSANISLAQTDITISAALDNQITAGPTFTDSGNDGGTSNLNSGTLTTSLNTDNVVVNTATTLPQFSPNSGRITVLDTISNASLNNLSLIANSDIEVGTSIALTGGGSLTLDAQGGAVAINSNLTITGGTSNLSIIANGAVTDGASTAINVQGLASINAGSNSITLGETNTDSVNFGSLALIGDAVSITENSHTNLESVAATTLTLSSSGDITDSGNVATTGFTTLNGTSITLGGAGENTSFGSLNFNSTGAVNMSLDANTTITGANSGFSVDMSSSGNSSFAIGATLNTASLVQSSGTITLSGNNLVDTMAVDNSGTLTVNGDDAIHTYQQNGSGTLAGSAALTVTSATLNGGTVSGNLQGNTTSAGTVGVTGTIGGGTLNITTGALTLSGAGSLTSTPITISSGASVINQNGGIDNNSNVSNSGTLTINANETVNTYTQSGALSVLNGTHTLTATNGSILSGGTVSGSLQGDANIQGNVLISGLLGGGTLTVTSGTLTLTGSSTHNPVNILAAGTLLNQNAGLATTANVDNAGTFTLGMDQTINTFVNSGLLNGGQTLTTSGTSTFNGGTLANGSTLNATGGTTLNNGSSVAGTITGGAVSSNGSISATGALNGSSLSVNNGTLTFSGTSTSDTVSVLSGATLLSTGNLSNSAALTNAGTYTINVNDTVGTYVQNGVGLLNGSSVLTASSGATLNGGTVAASLLANTVSTGNVSVSGTIGGGTFSVTSGRLTLTGTINSSPVVSPGATFQGTGLVTGGMVNQGTLAVGTMGEDLTVSGALNTTGTVSLRLLNTASFEKLTLGSIQQGGNLAVTNVGAGLTVGQTARIIEAGSYSGDFDSLNASGYINGVLYNSFTGTLVGLGGGEIVSDGGYLNLNNNQSNIYFSLFDDSVQPGIQNVSFDTSLAGATTVYLSGISDGDAQLVRALNEATYTTPGSISGNVMNLLSPESHHGMADYSEETLRSAVRKAIDAPTFSLKGKTQIFATLHTTAAGTDNDVTNAGYDLNTAGLTVGARHEMTQTFQAGFLAGMNYGSIEGELIDTDAQGFSLGVFGRLIADTKSKTMITGSLAFGSNTFDATRTSYEGDVTADSIGASSFEGSLGVSTVIYEKNGFSLSPNATIRYFSGSVDGFTEAGSGVALTVDSQDIDSVVIDVGLNALVPINQQLSFVGRVGYMHELSDSEETIGASFNATGVNAVPFSVNARGIDHQAMILGGGFNYDFIGGGRLGVSYQGEFRFDAQSSQSVYLGYSLGF